MRSTPFVALAAMLFMAACTSPAPKCADKATINLVLQIAREELVRKFGQAVADQIELRLDAIRTTASDDKTGAQQCAAQLVGKGAASEGKSDITYKSELTDKDRRQYVTVWGL